MGDLLGAVTLSGQGKPDEDDGAADRLGDRDRLAEQRPRRQYGEQHLGEPDQ